MTNPISTAIAAIAALPAGSRVAILGSREACPTLLTQVSDLIAAIPASVELVTGGSVVPGGRIIPIRGVCAHAAATARRHGLPVDVAGADWSAGKGAGAIRSRSLLASVSLAIIFWSGSAATSPGTAEEIRLCYRLGVSFILVVCPDAAAASVSAPSLW